MKKLRKIAAVLLAVIALAGMTSSVNASESIQGNVTLPYDSVTASLNSNIVTDIDVNLAMQTSIPNMLYALVNMPEYLGFSIEEVADVKLGDCFYISNIENGIAVLNESIAYFPILSDDSVIAVISLIKYDGELNAKISKGFAPKLNSFLDDNADEDIVLVAFAGESIAALSDDADFFQISGDDGNSSLERLSGQIELASQDIFETISDNKNTIRREDLMSETVPAYDIISMHSDAVSESAKSYYIDKAPISPELVEQGEVEFGSEFAPSPNAGDTSSSEASSVELVDYGLLRLDAYNPGATAVGDYLDGYQIVGQGPTSLCWAATIASMVRWELPSSFPNLTAVQVSNAVNVGNNGSTTQININALNFYLPTNVYEPTAVSRPLTQAEIQVVTSNEDPAIIGAYNGTFSHATALCGWLTWTDGTFNVRSMNPGPAAFELTDRSFSSAFRYDYNSTWYTWVDTIRLFYD
jgi:hypothetical protein